MDFTYQVRRAREQDINELGLLLKELFSIESDFSFNIFKQKKGLKMLLEEGKRACVMTAEHAGGLIGMCTAQLIISTAQGTLSGLIEDLVVLEPYRGRGVGKSLLEAVETWCFCQDVSRLELRADKDNRPALEFYDSRNWQRTSLVGLFKKQEQEIF